MSFSSYYTNKKGGDRIFSVEAPKIKFGRGSLKEIGDDASALGMTRVALFTDPKVAQLEPVSIVVDSLKSKGLDAVVYDQVAVEPTDISFKAPRPNFNFGASTEKIRSPPFLFVK